MLKYFIPQIRKVFISKPFQLHKLVFSLVRGGGVKVFLGARQQARSEPEVLGPQSSALTLVTSHPKVVVISSLELSCRPDPRIDR